MAENQKDIFFALIETNIRLFAKRQKITLSDLSAAIGMTEAGFYKMLSTESIKVKTLKRLSEVLHQPMESFFRDNTADQTQIHTDANQMLMVAEPESEYLTEKESLKKQVALLESQIADKNKIIELMSKKKQS